MPVQNFPSSKTLLAAASSVTLLLAACGGGGGDSATSGVVSGTVAVGQPVAGARVSAKCAAGNAPTPVTTNASGAYRLDLGSATAPCMLEAKGGKVGAADNTLTLHGFAAGAGTVNITSLTEVALAQALAQQPGQAFAAYSAGTGKAAQGKLDAAQAWLNQQLATLGLAPAKDSNVFTTPFKADGKDAADQLLDQFSAVLQQQEKSLSETAAAAARAEPLVKALGDKVVSVRFAARSGDAPIQCGETVKVKGVDMQAWDFRFYISNVSLIKADGGRVPLKLPANDNHNFTTADGKDSVSLVDLRQPKGYCSTKATHYPAVTGTVPWGDYAGAELTLGVPLQINHFDPSNDTTTPAVLRSSVHPAMSWAWRAGRKFTNIEMELPLGFKKDASGRYLTADGNFVKEAVRDAFGKAYDANGNTISNGKIVAPDGTAIGDATLVDANGAPITGPIVKNSDNQGVVYAKDGSAIAGAKVLDETGAAVISVATTNNNGTLYRMEGGKWVKAPGWKVVDASGKALPLTSASPVNLDKWTLLHLGSTTCPAVNSTAGTPGAAPAEECKAPNRVPLTFAQFNPATQQIALDVQALFADDDLTAVNSCMSGITHAACTGPFKALGLDWKADGSGNGRPIAGQAQTVFKVIAK